MQILPARAQIGDKPVALATFTDNTDMSRIVTALTFEVYPEGDPTQAVSRDQNHGDVTEISPNNWRCVLPTVTVPGIWWVRVTSTAVLVASDTTFFEVEEAKFPTI